MSGASAGDSGTWRWEVESYVLGAARGEAGTGEVAVEVEEVNTTSARVGGVQFWPFPNTEPTLVKGDGDGTVNIRSLKVDISRS